MKIVIHEDSSNVVKLVLPPLKEDLSDTELASVAGSFCWEHCSPRPPEKSIRTAHFKTLPIFSIFKRLGLYPLLMVNLRLLKTIMITMVFKIRHRIERKCIIL